MAPCKSLWINWWQNITDVDIGLGIAVSATFLRRGN